MIKRDEAGFIIDNLSGDQMDTCNRTAIMAICGSKKDEDLLPSFVYRGYGLRSPREYPANNKNNFTRDQLIPLIAALYLCRDHAKLLAAKGLFQTHAKRFFFCQNIERDKIGSTKYPFPHHYEDDRGVKRFSWFDYRDPLLPDHVWILAKAANHWSEPLFRIFGAPLLLLKLVYTRFFDQKDNELNQLFCQCALAGYPWLIKFKSVKGWRESMMKYWGGWRDQKEIGEAIITFVEKV